MHDSSPNSFLRAMLLTTIHKRYLLYAIIPICYVALALIVVYNNHSQMRRTNMDHHSRVRRGDLESNFVCASGCVECRGSANGCVQCTGRKLLYKVWKDNRNIGYCMSSCPNGTNTFRTTAGMPSECKACTVRNCIKCDVDVTYCTLCEDGFVADEMTGECRKLPKQDCKVKWKETRSCSGRRKPRNGCPIGKWTQEYTGIIKRYPKNGGRICPETLIREKRCKRPKCNKRVRYNSPRQLLCCRVCSTRRAPKSSLHQFYQRFTALRPCPMQIEAKRKQLCSKIRCSNFRKGRKHRFREDNDTKKRSCCLTTVRYPNIKNLKPSDTILKPSDKMWT